MLRSFRRGKLTTDRSGLEIFSSSVVGVQFGFAVPSFGVVLQQKTHTLLLLLLFHHLLNNYVNMLIDGLRYRFSPL